MPKKERPSSLNERQIRHILADFCAELDLRRVGKAVLPALLGMSLTGCPPRSLYAGPPPDDPRIAEPKPAYAAPELVEPKTLYAAPEPVEPKALIQPTEPDDIGDLYAAPDPMPEYAAVGPGFDEEGPRALYEAPEPVLERKGQARYAPPEER